MRSIAFTDSFDRKLNRFLRLHKELVQRVSEVLHLLENDVNSLSLHTHKLHGKLGKSYACSINYQYRLVFGFDDKHIFPKSIGSHDDVY